METDEVSSPRATQTGPPRKRIGPPEVRIDNLSTQQHEALSAARDIYLAAGGVLDELWQPFLIRFLVAHKWSVGRATEQLQATARWRQTSGANVVRRRLREGWRPLEMYYVLENQRCVWFFPTFGLAYTGDVISHLFVGTLDVPAWMQIIDDAQYFQYNLAIMEFQSYTNDRLTAQGRTLVRHVNVFDCAGMCSKHLSPRALRRLKPCMPLGDLYYPEFMSCALCINAPWIFTKIWAVLRLWLSKDIQARTEIVSRSETPAVIARLAPLSEIPTATHYGMGTLAVVPRSVSERIGYAFLEQSTIRSLLVEQPMSKGGCGGVFSIVGGADGPGDGRGGGSPPPPDGMRELRVDVPAERGPSFAELARRLPRPTASCDMTPDRWDWNDTGPEESRVARARLRRLREAAESAPSIASTPTAATEEGQHTQPLAAEEEEPPPIFAMASLVAPADHRPDHKPDDMPDDGGGGASAVGPRRARGIRVTQIEILA
jgi:hypothetical protein